MCVCVSVQRVNTEADQSPDYVAVGRGGVSFSQCDTRPSNTLSQALLAMTAAGACCIEASKEGLASKLELGKSGPD